MLIRYIAAALLVCSFFLAVPMSQASASTLFDAHLTNSLKGDTTIITVTINFSVDTKGEIDKVKKVTTSCATCSKEIKDKYEAKALVKIQEMTWKPGIRNGQFVKTWYTLPMKFMVVKRRD